MNAPCLICLLTLLSTFAGLSGCARAISTSISAQEGEPFQPFQGGIVTMAYSPDGTYLACGHNEILPSNMRAQRLGMPDAEIHIWDIGARENKGAFKIKHGTWHLVFAPDSKSLIVEATDEGGLVVWDIDGRTLQKCDVGGPCVASPCGQIGAYSARDGVIAMIRVVGNTTKATLNVEERPIALSNDGKLLATIDGSYSAGVAPCRVSIWNVARTTRQVSFRDLSASRFRCAFSPDGDQFATASIDENVVRLWDTQDASKMRPLNGRPGVIWDVAFSPDGRLLASCSEGQNKGRGDGRGRGLIEIWETGTGRALATFNDDSTWGITAVAFSPDGKTLASGDGDGNIKFWHVASGR
jgi:WD40 repeat protein